MGYGYELKVRLKNRGMTIKKLSEISGIPRNTLYSITKRDSNRIDIATKEKIEESLGGKIEMEKKKYKIEEPYDVPIDDNLSNIRDFLEPADCFLQLAEEAAELAAASAKMARILNGANPSPKSKIEVYNAVNEELADVIVVTTVLKLDIDYDFMAWKVARWAKRLEEHGRN